MQTINHSELALLTAIAPAVSLGLVAGSDDTPTAPAASTLPTGRVLRVGWIHLDG
jgi:hypothetical protein